MLRSSNIVTETLPLVFGRFYARHSTSSPWGVGSCSGKGFSPYVVQRHGGVKVLKHDMRDQPNLCRNVQFLITAALP
jgi:hypothetical protein